MKVISITNQKGGTGKSTITMLLACCLASEEKSVAILDCDTQRTILRLSEHENESIVDVFKCPLKEVPSLLKKLENVGCEIAFLDLPRFTGNDKVALLTLDKCNIVFVPSLGGLIELLSTKEFLTALDAMELKNYAFINRMTRKSEDFETIEVLKENHNVMNNHLKDLKIFRNPSLTKSILDTKDGQTRFSEFYNEFKNLANIE
jgi:chromosome partitioning protein